jgi:hypothetical protein
MSLRIANRFGLKPSERRSVGTKEVKYQGQLPACKPLTLVPSGKVVDLTCSQQSCRHCFHIVEHVPFDILLGKEFS